MQNNADQGKISAVITTQNNEDTITVCLESIKDIGDIVIVDSFSSDKTIELVKKYTDRIYFRRWDGFYEQKKYAVSLANNDWVLFLDSDDVLDEELLEEIYRTLSRNEQYTGYEVKVVANFLGRDLKYTVKPFFRIKLFRKNKTIMVKNGIDEDFTTENLGRITKGILRHFTSTTARSRLSKTFLYASLFADECYNSKEGKKWFVNIFYWPVRSFFGAFFIQQGFRDGWPGFLWCLFNALQHFLRYWIIGKRRIKSKLRTI